MKPQTAAERIELYTNVPKNDILHGKLHYYKQTNARFIYAHLCYKKGESNRALAKRIGFGETTTYRYVHGFKARLKTNKEMAKMWKCLKNKVQMNKDETILNGVCDCLGVSVDELRSDRRSSNSVNAKIIYCHLRILEDVSFNVIAKSINRNAVNVCYYDKVYDTYLTYDKNFRDSVKKCDRIYKMVNYDN